jgi:hypothetical protein
MAAVMNPFGQEHCDCFKRVAAQGGQLAELLDCLQECGIDMAPVKAQNDETVRLASNLRAKFFPNEV